ncbi:hypothetical protein NPX13_g5331 [Xylaria arbuscula]|uniref:Uncharacterized protein n=1 Tax=Xylaria arbuscula TaxID=114810 RepID=A0A9W8NEQ9_9PEZI|nr:hypothetical protein NPX13_g5331 [Xylaria arbuscula]
MSAAQPINTLTMDMGPSGVELGIDEQHKKFKLLLDFIKPQEECAGRDRSGEFTGHQYSRGVSQAASPARASIELQPVCLPGEVFVNIILYLEEPYKLQGDLTVSDAYPLIFFRDVRSWKDITALRICHATRMRAIRIYGKPSSDSMPFDAELDTFSLRHLEFARPRYISCKPLGIDLLAKVKHVEIQEFNTLSWPSELIEWAYLFLTRSRSVRTLRLIVQLHDNCSVTGFNNYRCFMHHRLLFPIFANPSLLKALEVIEAKSIEPVCADLGLESSIPIVLEESPQRSYDPTVPIPVSTTSWRRGLNM